MPRMSTGPLDRPGDEALESADDGLADEQIAGKRLAIHFTI
jgi:hypothetical protein